MIIINKNSALFKKIIMTARNYNIDWLVNYPNRKKYKYDIYDDDILFSIFTWPIRLLFRSDQLSTY